MKTYSQQEIDRVNGLLDANIANVLYPQIYKYTMRVTYEDKINDIIMCGFVSAHSTIHALQLFQEYVGQKVLGWKKLEIHNPLDNKVISTSYGI